MILPTLASREACSGCTACKAICPKDAISMIPDGEGFLRPRVDVAKCIGCHRCEQMCPVLHPGEPDTSPTCYAAYTKDERLRLQSSSGGIFTELAKPVIAAGGVVFGCIWVRPQLVAIHAKAETMDELAAMRGSKYVQSDLRETFREAKAALLEGRQVLFSGTPCQIAGLNGFLGKHYDNLLTVEIICHGVPSPAVFNRYKQELTKSSGVSLAEVRFRVKAGGGTWEQPHMVVTSGQGAPLVDEPLYDNAYIQAYFSHLCLRPSCHTCVARSGCSGVDVTIGDFWKVRDVLPEWDGPQGVSIAIVHTDRGKEAVQRMAPYVEMCSVRLGDIVVGNPSYERSMPPHPSRAYFMRSVGRCSSIGRLTARCVRGPWLLWMGKCSLRKLRKVVKG